jgi:CBS domain containing-hemolysin-like protein
VPRVRITGIPVGSTPDRIRELLKRSSHTRYPVVESDLDHILGMIHIKDLLRMLLRGETITPAHARPVPLVPETAPLDTVLATMRRERTQMVIVLDEHGGTSGIVTLEDLFDEVVGEIEEGSGTPAMYRDRGGRLRVPGTMRIDEIGREFDLELEHQDVDSVSGLILTVLGRPPRVGDIVRYDRLEFEVTRVTGRGVEEAAVSMAA